MEKHYKSVIHRSICDYFFEAQSKCAKLEDIPTVISTPHHKLIVIYRNKLYFVAVVVNEGLKIFQIHFCINKFLLIEILSFSTICHRVTSQGCRYIRGLL